MWAYPVVKGRIRQSPENTQVQRQSRYKPLLPPQPENTSCVICSKVCKTASGQKRHMVVPKDVIPQTSKVNPMKAPSFICHVCFKPCKSAAGLKSRFREHGRKKEEEDGEEMETEMAII